MIFDFFSSRHESERGFTLLEVIVALMIAGFALAAMLGSLETGLTIGGRADQELQMVSIAHSQLDGALAMPVISPGTQSFDMPSQIHSIVETRQIATTRASNGAFLGLFSVTVSVHREGSSQTITLMGRAVRPAVQD